MARSQWHRFYNAEVAAQPAVLFELLSDMPSYRRWLPQSDAFGETTEVEPYPVQLGSKYHDGKPAEPGKDWWGTVIGFQPPGSIDFNHVIHIGQLRATVDVHIHYSFEREGQGTLVNRWLVLDITMPATFVRSGVSLSNPSRRRMSERWTRLKNTPRRIREASRSSWVSGVRRAYRSPSESRKAPGKKKPPAAALRGAFL
jgi:hypothetical protein